MDTDTLRSQALAFERTWVETGGHAEPRPWGRIVRNLRYPRIFMANLAWVHALPPEGPEPVLEDLEAAFEGTPVRHRQLIFEDAREAFDHQEALASRGFQPLSELVMARLGLPVCIANPDVALREVGPEAPPEQYAAVRRMVHASFGYDPEESEHLLALEHERAEAVGLQAYVGYVKDEPAGTISVWPRGPFALLEDVATLPRFRMQGVGRTMIFEAGKVALRDLCEWTLLTTNLLDAPQAMYRTLGYTPVGEIRSFLKL